MDPEEAGGLASFLRPLLECDPLKRPEPSDLLSHPWIAASGKSSRGQRQQHSTPGSHQQIQVERKRKLPWWRFRSRAEDLPQGGGSAGDTNNIVHAESFTSFPHIFSDGWSEETLN